jgi:hypothetical protein
MQRFGHDVLRDLLSDGSSSLSCLTCADDALSQHLARLTSRPDFGRAAAGAYEASLFLFIGPGALLLDTHIGHGDF